MSRKIDAGRATALRFGLRVRRREGHGHRVIWDEPRIRFGEDIRVPDLGGWRKERWPPPRTGPLTLIPDWISEVLSRSTETEDRAVKLPLYARAKVGHVWLISPEARTLEVYRLEAAGWLLCATHAGDVRVRAEPFDAVELDLSLLWLPKVPDDGSHRAAPCAQISAPRP